MTEYQAFRKFIKDIEEGKENLLIDEKYVAMSRRSYDMALRAINEKREKYMIYSHIYARA